MKKRLITATITAAFAISAFGGAALADHTPTQNDNASSKACFGQWRSMTADGAAFSERKGTNAQINAENKAYCAHE